MLVKIWFNLVALTLRFPVIPPDIIGNLPNVCLTVLIPPNLVRSEIPKIASPSFVTLNLPRPGYSYVPGFVNFLLRACEISAKRISFLPAPKEARVKFLTIWTAGINDAVPKVILASNSPAFIAFIILSDWLGLLIPFSPNTPAWFIISKDVSYP